MLIYMCQKTLKYIYNINMLIAQAADCMVMMLISSFRNALLLVYSYVFCVTLLRGVIIRQWGGCKIGCSQDPVTWVPGLPRIHCDSSITAHIIQ